MIANYHNSASDWQKDNPTVPFVTYFNMDKDPVLNKQNKRS